MSQLFLIFFFTLMFIESSRPCVPIAAGWGRAPKEQCHKRVGTIIYPTSSTPADKTLTFRTTPSNESPYGLCIKENENVFWTTHLLSKTRECDQNETYEWSNIFVEHLNVTEVMEEAPPNMVIKQLVPQCDFNDKSAREMTYAYINAGLQNKDFAEGNWRLLEEFARNEVNKKYRDMQMKIITMPLSAKTVIQKLVPVPTHYAKILIYDSGDVEAYIGENNVEGNEAPPCDVIPECGWPDASKGRIHCCKVNQRLLETLGMEEKDVQWTGTIANKEGLIYGKSLDSESLL